MVRNFHSQDCRNDEEKQHDRDRRRGVDCKSVEFDFMKKGEYRINGRNMIYMDNVTAYRIHKGRT